MEAIQVPQKIDDEQVERACAYHAWETNRAFLYGVSDFLTWPAWHDAPQTQKEAMIRLVRFVLAGGTAEANWQLYCERPENADKALPTWEKVPYTQRAKDELAVASINAMAMALGHSKRPLEVHHRVVGVQPQE